MHFKMNFEKDSPKNALIQTSILVSLQNWRNKEKMLTKNTKINRIEDLTNSDEAEREKSFVKIKLEPRKLPFPSRDIENTNSIYSQRIPTPMCLNKPNTPSISSKSCSNKNSVYYGNETPKKQKVKILENIQISPSKSINSETKCKMPKRHIIKCKQISPSKNMTVTELVKDSNKKSIETPVKSNKSSPVKSNKSSPAKSNKSSPVRSVKKEFPVFSPKIEKKTNEVFLKTNNQLISSILQSNNNILLEEEDKIILANIQKADSRFQYVCFKLYMWLPKWYMLSEFVKKIGLNFQHYEIVELYKFLINNDIAVADYSKEDVEFLLNLLKIEDIKKICTSLRIRIPQQKKPFQKIESLEETDKIPKGRKNQCINLIMEKCKSQATLTLKKSMKDIVMELIEQQFGKHVVKIKENFKKSFERIFILSTYTNPQLYNINDFFRHITNIDFPDYDVQENYCVFYSKSDFLCYVNARFYRDKLDIPKDHVILLQMGLEIFTNLKELCQDNDESRFKKTPHLQRFTAKSVYISSLTIACEKLYTKYEKEVTEWLEYLIKHHSNSHRLASWYICLSKIHKARQVDCKGADLIITALKDKINSFTEVQKEELAERGRILLKSRYRRDVRDKLMELLPRPIDSNDFPEVMIDQKTVRGNVPGRKRDYEITHSDGSKTYKGVEEVALDYYLDKSYTGGVHCEGSIINSLFSLFFWDLIYSPKKLVPATFLSKFQFYPLDLHTPYFYAHRKKAIDRRLQDIKKDWSFKETLKFVEDNWNMYSHKTTFCSIDKAIPDTEFLNIIVICIGRKILAKIFERLVKDISQYRSGMPDLLVWNRDKEEAKFVEVKGENDKLSITQTLWLKYLKSIGANVEVCYVHSKGSKRKLFGEKKIILKNKSKHFGEKEQNPSKNTNEILSTTETGESPSKKCKSNYELNVETSINHLSH